MYMMFKRMFFKVGEQVYKLFYNLLALSTTTKEKVLVISNVKVEDNAVAMANYIAQHYTLEIAIMLPKNQQEYARQFLYPSITIYDSPRHMPLSWKAFKIVTEHKYVFLTYQFLYGNFRKKQIFTNLWHGLAYKKIQSARKYDGIRVQADFTVAASSLTRKMFAALFDVPISSVLKAGLPRNDLLLNSQSKKAQLKEKLSLNFQSYNKVFIWMPTYRRMKDQVGIVTDNENIFNVPDFDTAEFNSILKKHNALCLVKSHHMVQSFDQENEFDHILNINDQWLQKEEVLLYQLLACTDALISDYSSVLMDYTLLEQPIFCIATDLEDYKKYQGLCFDDFENWVPSKLHQNQTSFLKAIQNYLSSGIDPYESKRKKIRDMFFEHKDAKASKKIAEHIIEKKD